MNHTLPRQKILKHISIFTSSSFIQSIGQLFHSYFGARWLGPDTFGAWQGARLVQAYLSYANLGVGHGMHRNVPVLRGQDRLEDIEKIKNCTWSFNVVVFTLLSIGLFISSFFVKGNYEFLLSLRFIAILLEINMFNGFFYVWNNSNNRFEVVSTAAVISGITNIASIYLIYSGKLTGFLIAKIITLSLILSYYLYKNDTQLSFYLKKSIIINEIKVGFPILLVTLSATVFSTIDRILILSKLNFSDLGLYSLSGIIFMPISIIFNSINLVLYPRVTEKFGATNRPETLANMFKIPLLILSHIMPFLLASLYLLIPLVVNLFLPKYEFGIKATQIVIWGIFFYSLVGTVTNVVIALNKQIYMVLIIGIMTLLNFLFGSLLIDWGFGIAGVALSSSIIYLVYFLILYCWAYVLTTNNSKNLLIDYYRIIFPTAVNLIAVLLMNYYIDLSEINAANILNLSIMVMLLFALNFKFFHKAFLLLGIKSLKDIRSLFKFS